MYGLWVGEWIRGGGRFASRPKPWAARITGIHPKWRYRREFVKAVYDYTRVNGKRGGRGIYLYFPLAPGLYELYRPISWKHEERLFAHVDDNGTLQKITEEELRECLNDTSA